jgi:hypothetical protein
MNRRRTLLAVALCLSLVVLIVAQEKQSKPAGPTVAPPTTVPHIPVMPGAPPATAAWPHFPHGVTPALNPPILPGSVVPTQGREHYTVPAKVEFDDGTMLSGEIHSDGPLQCMALFGATAIPFYQIKGIEWRSGTEQPEDQERKATLVLINNDALTVVATTPKLQLKTTWGHAAVELAHVRSIVMTSEKVKWVDTPDGRRELVPDADAPDAKEEKIQGSGAASR